MSDQSRAQTLESYFDDGTVALYVGDCRDVLRGLPDTSVDAVVTDPPYELGFMGRAWDASGIAYDVELWRECLRVLKPGGHLLAFGGTRTWHRLAVAIEDAGFEVRDCLQWLYGSGFPKSLDVSKAIDKAAGAEREVTGSRMGDVGIQGGNFANATQRGVIELRDKPATDDASAWEGWGTALKPGWEPVVVARRPLAGTVAHNVLTHGTGALNVDGCRVEPTGESRPRVGEASQERRYSAGGNDGFAALPGVRGGDPAGRWPTNLVLTHSAACVEDGPCAGDCPVGELDRQSGVRTSGKMRPTHTTAGRSVYGQNAAGGYTTMETYGDTGGASRFYPTFRYEAKAGQAERPKLADGTAHPTVKPVALMRWLVRLVTPPGGVVLDPFAGSGTTAEACIVEGFNCVLVELEESHAELIKVRLSKAIQPSLFGEAS